MYMDYKCNEINETLVGKKIKVAGWVSSIRDHGGVTFVDLRDTYGILQIVSNDDCLSKLSKESTISVQGTLRERDASLVNDKSLISIM